MVQTDVNGLLLKFQPLIHKLAIQVQRQLRNGGIVANYDDIVQELTLELLLAVEAYKEDQKCSLTTWVFTRLVNFVSRRLVYGKGHGGYFAERPVSYRCGKRWVHAGRPVSISEVRMEDPSGEDENFDPSDTGTSVTQGVESPITDEMRSIGRAIILKERDRMPSRLRAIVDRVLAGQEVGSSDFRKLVRYFKNRRIA
jgi:DNA-directed RNA polymerase specialized sigma24 family protein